MFLLTFSFTGKALVMLRISRKAPAFQYLNVGQLRQGLFHFLNKMVQFTETGWKLEYDYSKAAGTQTPDYHTREDYPELVTALISVMKTANAVSDDWGPVPFQLFDLLTDLLPTSKQIEVALPAWRALAAAKDFTPKR